MLYGVCRLSAAIGRGHRGRRSLEDRTLADRCAGMLLVEVEVEDLASRVGRHSGIVDRDNVRARLSGGTKTWMH